MEYVIRQGAEPDRQGIAETIVEAFYEQFKALTTDKAGVAKGLSQMLHPERFTVAVDPQGQVVGTVGLSDERGYAVTVQAEILRKAMGLIKGNIAALALKDEFYRPKTFEPGQAQLDFVGVREAARGQHLATRMLEDLLSQGGYRLYTLDVVEGNERVLPLYEGLGFRETGTEKEKNAWAKGFSFRHLLAYRPGENRDDTQEAARG